MYDYFSTTSTPNYGANQSGNAFFFNVVPHRILVEEGSKNVAVFQGDDVSQTGIAYDDNPTFL